MANPPTIAIFFLSLLRVLFTVVCFTSYTPLDHFAVTCGSSGDSPSSDGRNWIGDQDSERFSLIELPNGSYSSVGRKARGKTSPYNTARLSRSVFSYWFATKSKGQKFIRLYFYASSYDHKFIRSDSFFSVRVGSHTTLLKDFNASFTADGTGKETIFREYCINNFEPSGVMITFMPNPSHQSAYAFICGIEVLSMPDFLYYTNPKNLQGMQLDGGTQQFPVQNSSSLETLYRINVGGRKILPNEDTGMFRYWDPDDAYLERERPYSLSACFGLKLDYKDYPNVAPDELYLTARNYGMNERSKSNVTWEFQVDPLFHCMVRLHFCEFDGLIEKAGDRVFQIFINDALVESIADVMMWTQNQRLVPVHRDYAVRMMSDGSLKKVNLSIKLQPHPTANSTYRDVLLNGIEIFRISDFRNNLTGFNPHQPPSPSQIAKASKMRVISIIVGSASGFLLLSLIVLLTYCRLARLAINGGNSQWGLELLSTSKTNKSSLLPSDLCRCFSIREVKASTNNFDDSLIIGVGGFGNVYKGHIDNNSVPVAIKRLRQGSQQGIREFQTEIEMLSQLRHHHLVSLIGYCNDDSEMILVYEFMARGTLREHLYDSENKPLPWNQRLEICLGAARGLHYLHTGAKHAIIHRDVKSTNILIDENWMAKISDFGLSKIGPGGISRSNINISTAVKGSIGYLDRNTTCVKD